MVNEKKNIERYKVTVSRGGSFAMCCKGKISERKIEIETQGQQGLSHLDGYMKAEIYKCQTLSTV